MVKVKENEDSTEFRYLQAELHGAHPSYSNVTLEDVEEGEYRDLVDKFCGPNLVVKPILREEWS